MVSGNQGFCTVMCFLHKALNKSTLVDGGEDGSQKYAGGMQEGALSGLCGLDE